MLKMLSKVFNSKSHTNTEKFLSALAAVGITGVLLTSCAVAILFRDKEYNEDLLVPKGDNSNAEAKIFSFTDNGVMLINSDGDCRFISEYDTRVVIASAKGTDTAGREYSYGNKKAFAKHLNKIFNSGERRRKGFIDTNFKKLK